METLQVGTEHKWLNLDTARMQFKVELLCQQLKLLKEGVLQEDIDNLLPIVNDLCNTFSLIHI